MSIFDNAKKSLEGLIKDTLSPKKPRTQVQTTIQQFEMNSVYSLDPNGDYSNWYLAKPYGFTFIDRNGTSVTMFLPISPSNLTINTNFATNIVPTLYGTVEEHSEIRYYDISIEGTTGMAPKFVDPYFGSPSQAYSSAVRPGRISTPISRGITGVAGGFFSKTLGAIAKAANKAVDLVSDSSTKREKGFLDANSGYVAFHNLYRFLKKYKDDVSGIAADGSTNTTERTRHPLTFFNYKDGNSYDVAVRSFTLRRSADNPMLYYYSIQLRGYNLRSVADKIDSGILLKQRQSDLQLNGVEGSSAFSKFQKFAKNGKSLLKSTLGAIDIFGR